MGKRWLRVLRDTLIIKLALLLVRYIPLFTYPRDFSAVETLVQMVVLTILPGTLLFCLAACLAADDRKWHMPRLFLLVWASGLALVVLRGRESMVLGFFLWLLSVIPLGLAMLVGWALSYRFVAPSGPRSGLADEQAIAPATRGFGLQALFVKPWSVWTWLFVVIGVETILVMIIFPPFDSNTLRHPRDFDGDYLVFVAVTAVFLLALPAYSFLASEKMTGRIGLRFLINKIIGGITFLLTVLLFNSMVGVKVVFGADGGAWLTALGPLYGMAAIGIIAIAIVNVVVLLFNWPRRRTAPHA